MQNEATLRGLVRHVYVVCPPTPHQCAGNHNPGLDQQGRLRNSISDILLLANYTDPNATPENIALHQRIEQAIDRASRTGA